MMAQHMTLEKQLPKEKRVFSSKETEDFIADGANTAGRHPPCLLCKSEAEAGGVRGEHRQSSSSSSSRGYSGFPAGWSEPFMMRHLLWDLLGRIKPTAQQWFATHAHMCPHR
jgi:hypothetical protein